MKKSHMMRLWPLLLALLLVALTALADMKLPTELTVIDDKAFLNDFSLTGTLRIPDGVTVIGARAFEGTGLTGLIIPDSVASIGSRAFADCAALTGVVRIPDSVTALAADAFEGTDVTLVFGDDVTTDTDLPGVSTGTDLPGVSTGTDLPGTATPTDIAAFLYEATDAGCIITGYTGRANAALVIPAELGGMPVVAIGDYAFQDCSGLTGGVAVPETVTRIGTGAFFGCSSLNGTVTIPASVVSIGDFAFYECAGLKGSLHLPASVETVGSSAFAHCAGMTGSLTLPSDATLGSRCFQGAGFTGSLTVPATMTLAPNALCGTSLDITWEAPGFTWEQTGDAITLTGWNGPVTGGLTIPSSLGTGVVTDIAEEAFAGIGLQGAVSFPGTLSYIGDSAFRANPGLTSLTFSHGLTTVAAYAFADCTGLRGTITLPSSVTALVGTAFSGCDVTVEIAAE